MKVGIIDIGSNSIRMIVNQIHEDGSFNLIDEVKESVRLGDKQKGSNKLSEDRMNVAIQTLQLFLDLKEALGVSELICVATEAVRSADNREEFCHRAKKELGLEIRILSGKEEAYYDYIGAISTLRYANCLLVDIGGSSTELVRVVDYQLVHSASLPIGAIAISNMFQLGGGPVNRQTIDEMHSFLFETFKEFDWIQGDGPLVGIGGSFRNVAKIDRREKKYPLEISHNYQMTDEAVMDIYHKIRSMTKEERKKIKGLSNDRADIMTGALAEIAVILDKSKITKIVTSGAGLREGLFYDWLQKGENISNVLDFSIQNVIRNYEINQFHSRHVCDIALQLYHQLQDRLDINNDYHEVLKAAALLHDIGIHISYYNHHKHTFYEILNCHLYGLTHKELLMVAYIAALHGDSDINMAAKYRSILNKNEMETVRKLGVLLRIAESLDRRQNKNIYKISSTVENNRVIIFILAKHDPGLEIKAVQNATKNFYKVFKRHLYIQEEQ